MLNFQVACARKFQPKIRLSIYQSNLSRKSTVKFEKNLRNSSLSG